MTIGDAGYEIFNWRMEYIGWAEDLMSARGHDAVKFARSVLPTATVIVRCSDREPIMAFGRKPGMHLRIAREALMPGAPRGDA